MSHRSEDERLNARLEGFFAPKVSVRSEDEMSERFRDIFGERVHADRIRPPPESELDGESCRCDFISC